MIEFHTKYNKHGAKIIFDGAYYTLTTFIETGVIIETEERTLEQAMKRHHDNLEDFDRHMIQDSRINPRR